MKTLLLFTVLFVGCVSSKQQFKFNCPCLDSTYIANNPPLTTWQNGFIPNIEIDTLNIIKIAISDSACKHTIIQTTLAYCPDGGCNTVSCFSCGKKLGKQ